MLDKLVTKHILLAILSPGEDRTALEGILGHENWQLRYSNTFAETQTALHTFRVAVVLSDGCLSDGHSWRDVLRELDGVLNPPPLIVADRLADEALWAEVLNLGGYDLLAKPFDPTELLHAVSAAAHFRESQLERAAAPGKPLATAAASAPMKRAAAGSR